MNFKISNSYAISKLISFLRIKSLANPLCENFKTKMCSIFLRGTLGICRNKGIKYSNKNYVCTNLCCISKNKNSPSENPEEELLVDFTQMQNEFFLYAPMGILFSYFFYSTLKRETVFYKIFSNFPFGSNWRFFEVQSIWGRWTSPNLIAKICA